MAETVGGIALDSDAARAGLSRDLGFSNKDRGENVRRLAEVAKLVADQGVRVVVATVSPRPEDREAAAAIIGPERFLPLCLVAPKEELEARLVARGDPPGWAARKFRGPEGEGGGLSTSGASPAESVRRLRALAGW